MRETYRLRTADGGRCLSPRIPAGGQGKFKSKSKGNCSQGRRGSDLTKTSDGGESRDGCESWVPTFHFIPFFKVLWIDLYLSARAEVPDDPSRALDLTTFREQLQDAILL